MLSNSCLFTIISRVTVHQTRQPNISSAIPVRGMAAAAIRLLMIPNVFIDGDAQRDALISHRESQQLAAVVTVRCMLCDPRIGRQRGRVDGRQTSGRSRGNGEKRRRQGNSDRRTGSRDSGPSRRSPARHAVPFPLMIYDRVIMMQRLCYFKDKLIHSSSFFALLPGERERLPQ